MILTLRGYKLNILAAVVLVTSTKRHGVILPLYYRRHFVSINTTYIHTYIHTYHSFFPHNGHPIFHSINSIWNTSKVIFTQCFLITTKSTIISSCTI